MTRHLQNGFTLVEVMITVVIVAILAAIAYPSYIEQVRKTRRTEGQAMLVEIAAQQERYYTERNEYADSMTALGYSEDEVLTEGGWYELSVQSASNTDFELEAVPQRAQAGDVKCKTLGLDGFGNKTEKGSGSKQDCW